MAGTAPRLPEQFRRDVDETDFHVSEIASEAAGAHSPFGSLAIPMPLDKIIYTHPGPKDRPNLADDN